MLTNFFFGVFVQNLEVAAKANDFQHAVIHYDHAIRLNPTDNSLKGKNQITKIQTETKTKTFSFFRWIGICEI